MMTKIFTNILIFMVCGNYLAQTNYTALITDPQIGPDANADKLIEIVDDINNRDSISLVVVMGNITANGKFDEFLWAQEILDGLNAPYFVVGGEKDYTLSEGKGNEISLLWGDDKFYHLVNDDAFVGLNTFKPVYDSKGYYDIETRSWIHKKIQEHLKGQIFLIRYHNYSQHIANWEEIVDALTIPPYTRLINLITIDIEKAEHMTFMPYINLGRSFGSKEGWKYFLIKTKKGLSKIEVTKSEEGITVKEEDLSSLDRLPIRSSQMHKKEQLRNSLLELWKNKLEKSIATNPATNKNSIYIAGKHGSIISFNNSGKKLWEFETNGTIYSSPKIEKDLVVAATNEGDLFTINKNTGNLFQVIGIGETITSDIALVDIEHNGMKTKGIYFGTAEGNFYCYELYSLELIWWNQSAKDWINSSVAAVNGKVIFQDKKGTMYCLNSRSGVLLWKWKAKTKIFDPLFKSDLIVSNNNVYFIDFDGDLHCIDALLGTKKWSIRKIKATGKIELNEKKNEIVLHSEKNRILVVSLAKRKVNIEFILPDKTKDEIVTDIELIGDKLIVGFTNGDVYQIVKKQKLKNILWQSTAPIVSISAMGSNLLVTDYDGNLTLLDLSEEKK